MPTLPSAQDDLLHEALTVHETLYYAAMLRLPRHMSHEDKLRRVEVVTTALGLHTCQDTIIGDGGLWGGKGGQGRLSKVELPAPPGLSNLQCSRSIWVAHKCIGLRASCLSQLRNCITSQVIPAPHRRLLPQGRERRRAQAHLHRGGAADRPICAAAGEEEMGGMEGNGALAGCGEVVGC